MSTLKVDTWQTSTGGPPSFDNGISVSTGNVTIGRTNSTVGGGVLLDVAGGVNAASMLTTGNITVGRTDSTVGSGVKLDVAGSVNTSSLLLTSNVAFDTISSAVVKSPSANVISVSTAQSERARFDATGNLLIGRTSSTIGSGVKLDVVGGVNAASILVNGSPLSVVPTGTLLRAPQVLTTGTSYTTPGNCTSILVELQGGGGGSGGAATGTSFNGGSGSAGAYATKFFTVTPSTAYTYAIGGGGTAGTNAPTAGGNGGSTTFTVGATTVTATGGTGGGAGTSLATRDVAGVTATNADFAPTSAKGFSALGTYAAMLGGSTPFGAGGYSAIGFSNGGSPGQGYGAGASGGSSSGSGSSAGAAGAPGFIRIWEFA